MCRFRCTSVLTDALKLFFCLDALKLSFAWTLSITLSLALQLWDALYLHPLLARVARLPASSMTSKNQDM
jgi:hypothetical protein